MNLDTDRIDIRINDKLKIRATKIFDAIGLDMSTAIKMFLSQTVIENGLPFKPTVVPTKSRTAIRVNRR